MKYTLHCLPVNRPWNGAPARDIELEDKDIRANDAIFPWESNYHDTGLYVIGNEYGPLFAIWGAEHELLDIAVDANLMDSFLEEDQNPHKEECKDKDYNCDCETDLTRLGNASELFDITNCWYQRVCLDKLEPRLLCQFAEARGNQSDTLYF